MENVFRHFIEQYSNSRQSSEETETIICAHLSVLNLQKKHVIIRENQRHDFAYFVLSGAIRSFYLKDGIEVNTWFAFENDIVGSLNIYRNLPSKETFELVEDSTLIAINLVKLKPLIYSDLGVSNFISAIVLEYAVFLEERIFNYQLMNAIDRYKALVEYEPMVLQRIPLTYIASYLGISRETLSRMRGK